MSPLHSAIGALAFALASSAVFGQGQIVFNNRVTGVVDARVYRYPERPEVWEGVTAQLLGGPPGEPLQPLFPTTTFRTSSPAAYGYVVPVMVTVPGVLPGEIAIVQMRAYDGASYETSLYRGESPLLTLTIGGGILPPANLTGLQGFVIPEPSTIALVCLSLAMMAWNRRR